MVIQAEPSNSDATVVKCLNTFKLYKIGGPRSLDARVQRIEFSRGSLLDVVWQHVKILQRAAAAEGSWYFVFLVIN